MKKSLFIIAAAALVVSCANNDVRNEIVQSDMPIGFSKVYIEKGTKAAYNELGDFVKAGSNFGVFGYKTVGETGSETTSKVFGERDGESQGVMVECKQEGTGDNPTFYWEYSPLRYWDKLANKYSFYAYAPYNALDEGEDATSTDDDEYLLGTVALASNDAKAFSITGFKQKTAQADMVDIMTDLTSQNSVTGDKVGVNKVQFTFGHILSNINLMMAVGADLKNDETNNPVTVVSVSLGDIKMDGDYAYNSETGHEKYEWTLAEEATEAEFNAEKTKYNEGEDNEYEAVFGAGVLKANTNALSGGDELAEAKVGLTAVPGLTDLLFVPQDVNDADYAISIKYKIQEEVFEKTINLSEFTRTVSDEDQSLETWEPGTKYTYVLIIGPTPILFDVKAITDWADGGTFTYTID